MIEAQDIGDGEILGRTTMRKGPGNTRQLVYTGSDGHKMVSEWIVEDRVKEALRTWTETVRAQIVSLAKQAREEKRAQARRLAEQQPAPPVIDLPKTQTITSTQFTDPVKFAEEQAAAALHARDMAHEVLETAEEEYRQAVAVAEGWVEVVRSLQVAFRRQAAPEASQEASQAGEGQVEA